MTGMGRNLSIDVGSGTTAMEMSAMVWKQLLKVLLRTAQKCPLQSLTKIQSGQVIAT